MKKMYNVEHRESVTRKAGRARVSSLLSSGYRLQGTYPEPNHCYTIALYHPRTYRRLNVVVEPPFGMVLVKEHGRIIDSEIFP